MARFTEAKEVEDSPEGVRKLERFDELRLNEKQNEDL